MAVQTSPALTSATARTGAGLGGGLTGERADAPAIRRIGMEDIRIALRQGFDDYRAKRGEMIFLGLIYPIVGFFACVAIFRADLLPLAFPVAAGVSLMGPPFASGFYELARLRDLGQDPSFARAFDVWKSPPLAAIATLTLFVAALFGLWVLCAWGLYSALLGPAPPADLSSFLRTLFGTSAGWTLIVAGNVVGAAFALAVLVVSAVSFPMLVDRKAGPLTAAETSIRVARANPGTILAWGVTVAGVLMLGAIPLFIGLAVALPVLGYATWHLYTRAVVR